MLYVLAFIAGGAVVAVAGTALARHADAIADATGIGRMWVGAVLLAGATSLPELTTDISAVRLGATDLAVGDLFGSSMANMLILAVIDLMPPRRGVLQRVTLDHALGACLAIALNTMATLFVLLRPQASAGWVGAASLLLLFGYIAGTRAVYRQASRAPDEAPPSGSTQAVSAKASLRKPVTGFVVAALVVLAAAPAFAWGAKGIAELTGLGTTFVGTWLVGLATSLPEVVACVAAVRMGSFDLAVGNLFGSNAFNMAIFAALDVAQPGNIFAALDPSHAISGMFAVVLMSLGLAAIVYRAKRRFVMLEPDSWLMLAVYVAAVIALYRQIP